MEMQRVTTVTFTAALMRHGSWGQNDLGDHESEMTLYLMPDRSRGCIEWNIDSLDMTEEIGLWFEDGELVDYDGVMALPREAIALLRSYAFKVSKDFE